MSHRYILDETGRVPIPEPDVLKWAMWFEQRPQDRIVKQEQVGKFFVSTVFLGIDYNFANVDGKGVPLLWETMIFISHSEQYLDRYSTWELALQGHAAACDWARDNQDS